MARHGRQPAGSVGWEHRAGELKASSALLPTSGPLLLLSLFLPLEMRDASPLAPSWSRGFNSQERLGMQKCFVEYKLLYSFLSEKSYDMK